MAEDVVKEHVSDSEVPSGQRQAPEVDEVIVPQHEQL